MLVSRIGAPIDGPQVLSVRVRIEGDRPVSEYSSVVGEIARSGLAGLPTLTERLIAGEIPIY